MSESSTSSLAAPPDRASSSSAAPSLPALGARWAHEEFEPPLLLPQRRPSTTETIAPEVRAAGNARSGWAALAVSVLLLGALVGDVFPAATRTSTIWLWSAAATSAAVGAALLWAPIGTVLRSVAAGGYWITLGLALSIWQQRTGLQLDWSGAVPWMSLLVVASVVLVPARWPGATALMCALAAGPALARVLVTGRVSFLTEWSPLLLSIDWLAIGCGQLIHASLVAAWLRLGSEQRLVGYPLLRRLGGSELSQSWSMARGRLARPVNVHLMKPTGEARSRIRAEFQQEMSVAATLESPHTALIYEYGSTRHGELYAVVERCNGMTLRQLVERHGALPPERAIFLLLQLCHALAEGHARGMVHGALNPSNVVIGVRGLDYDWVRLFGLGFDGWRRIVGSVLPSRESDAVALAGLHVEGDYLAPEQIMGAGLVVSATDVHALGCLGYWMLAGRPPFVAETKRELVRLQLETSAPPLASLCKHRPPDDLAKVLADCLAKNPDERIVDATDLRQRLRRCLAASHWSSGRAKHWWDPVLRQSGEDESEFGPRLVRRDMLAGLLGRRE